MLISIVIPTCNESENVSLIANAINEALESTTNYEIIFVDDSTDNTPDVLQQLASVNPRVRYEHRENERGLGTAVVRGFQLAKGNVITVLDADLQHPPDMLNCMLDQIEAGYDVVIPSRFVPGGDDGGLTVHRKLISWVARMMGKIALKKVRPINDPTSGFIMFRRDVIEGVQLKPIGWKILIEILVKGHYRHVIEIPYRFLVRTTGESKMSLKEQWNYVRHLARLIKDSPEDRRFYTFALVGLSGVIVNMAIYAVFVHWGIRVPVAGALSAMTALVSNYMLNDRITWADANHGASLVRMAKYAVASLVGIAVDVAVLNVLYGAGVSFLAANLFGISVATVGNYVVNNAWVWKTKRGIQPVIGSQPLNAANSWQRGVAK